VLHLGEPLRAHRVRLHQRVVHVVVHRIDALVPEERVQHALHRGDRGVARGEARIDGRARVAAVVRSDGRGRVGDVVAPPPARTDRRKGVEQTEVVPHLVDHHRVRDPHVRHHAVSKGALHRRWEVGVRQHRGVHLRKVNVEVLRHVHRVVNKHAVVASIHVYIRVRRTGVLTSLVQVKCKGRRHACVQRRDQRDQRTPTGLRPTRSGVYVRLDRNHNRQTAHRPCIRANAEPPPPQQCLLLRPLKLGLLDTLRFVRNAALQPVCRTIADVSVSASIRIHDDAKRTKQKPKNHAPLRRAKPDGI
jgi:hypothetical protein